MSRYLIVIEETGTGFSAYSPDVPGCAATGGTREDVERTTREALAFHLKGLREDGQRVPEPSTSAVYVDVAA